MAKQKADQIWTAVKGSADGLANYSQDLMLESMKNEQT